jgi:hypothetical protein
VIVAELPEVTTFKEPTGLREPAPLTSVVVDAVTTEPDTELITIICVLYV